MSIDYSGPYIKLTGLGWFSYFSPALVGLSLLGSGIFICSSKLSSPVVGGIDEKIFVGVSLMAAGILIASFAFRLLARAQQYEIVTTANAAQQNYRSIKSAIERVGWRIERDITDKIVVSRTRSSWLSWGEIVAVRFDGNDVLIASICDPGKKPAVFGRHAGNKAVIRAAIESRIAGI